MADATEKELKRRASRRREGGRGISATLSAEESDLLARAERKSGAGVKGAIVAALRVYVGCNALTPDQVAAKLDALAAELRG